MSGGFVVGSVIGGFASYWFGYAKARRDLYRATEQEAARRLREAEEHMVNNMRKRDNRK